MIWIILLCVYIYLGDKANQFCKKNILHLETIIVYDISEWITDRMSNHSGSSRYMAVRRS